MATHSSILAWRIPWTEAPSGLQSRASHMTEHACTNTPFSNLNFRVFIPWVSVKILMVKNPGLLVRELLHTLMPTLWPLFELLSWRLLSICNTTLFFFCSLPCFFSRGGKSGTSVPEQREPGWWVEVVVRVGIWGEAWLTFRGQRTPGQMPRLCLPASFENCFYFFIYGHTHSTWDPGSLTRDRTHVLCTNFTEWSFQIFWIILISLKYLLHQVFGKIKFVTEFTW